MTQKVSTKNQPKINIKRLELIDKGQFRNDTMIFLTPVHSGSYIIDRPILSSSVKLIRDNPVHSSVFSQRYPWVTQNT